jgi:hypothetical protein
MEAHRGPCQVERSGDVAMQVRDGTTLRADVYRPESPPPWPVLLRRTPYGKRVNDLAADFNEAHFFASHGYLVVVQDTRGLARGVRQGHAGGRAVPVPRLQPPLPGHPPCRVPLSGETGGCGREDSNLHPFRDQDLNLARMPVSPRPRNLMTSTFILPDHLLGGRTGTICKPFANQIAIGGQAEALPEGR